VKPHHQLFLERTARELTKQSGRRVRPEEVLELLVELAIRDENLYDPESGAVLSTDRRKAEQLERDLARPDEPAARFALQRLLQDVKDAD
jgi:hypothetical protein